MIKFHTRNLPNILFFQRFRNQTRNTRSCADPRIFFPPPSALLPPPPPPHPLHLYFVRRFASNDDTKHGRTNSLLSRRGGLRATRKAAVSDCSGSISHFRNSERIRRLSPRPRACLRDREMEEASGREIYPNGCSTISFPCPLSDRRCLVCVISRWIAGPIQ